MVQLRVPLAPMPGSSVGNRNACIYFAGKSMVLIESRAVEGRVRSWVGRVHSPPGLRPSLPNHFAESNDTENSFSPLEIPTPLYPLFLLSHFLGPFCSVLFCFSCWYSLGHKVHIFQYSWQKILFPFLALPIIFTRATPKFIFKAYP